MVESNFTYHYTSDSIIISMSDPDGSNVISIKCELDSKGRVSKMLVPEVYDEKAVMYLFTYDKNNQLINSYASDNESETITWSEGNITSIVNQHKRLRRRPPILIPTITQSILSTSVQLMGHPTSWALRAFSFGKAISELILRTL